jgi:hypothetical protein
MFHNLFECSVVLLKFFAFLFELLFDIFITYKNSFKVHPFFLNLQPHLDTLRNQIESALPVANASTKSSCILAGGHGLQVSELVLKQ